MWKKSELSPSLQAYERRKEDELPELVKDQDELANMADEKDKTEENTGEIEEALKATPTATTELPKSNISKTTPQPTIPKPLGKVPAFILNTYMKRESRLKTLKKIKGN